MEEMVIYIDDKEKLDASAAANFFADVSTKNRAYINTLGAELALKYLKAENINTEDIYNIHSVKKVLEDIDISDIILSQIHIDVRVIFDKNLIFIPKSHFEFGLVPDIYLVMHLSEDISSVNLLGFFEPASIDKSNENDDYYFLEPDKLNPISELVDYINSHKKREDVKLSEIDTDISEDMMMLMADNDLSENNKKYLFKQLLKSSELRNTFIEFENFETLSNKIFSDSSIEKPELIQDIDIIDEFDDFEKQQDNFSNNVNDEFDNFDESKDVENIEDIETQDEIYEQDEVQKDELQVLNEEENPDENIQDLFVPEETDETEETDNDAELEYDYKENSQNNDSNEENFSDNEDLLDLSDTPEAENQTDNTPDDDVINDLLSLEQDEIDENPSQDIENNTIEENNFNHYEEESTQSNNLEEISNFEEVNYSKEDSSVDFADSNADEIDNIVENINEFDENPQEIISQVDEALKFNDTEDAPIDSNVEENLYSDDDKLNVLFTEDNQPDFEEIEEQSKDEPIKITDFKSNKKIIAITAAAAVITTVSLFTVLKPKNISKPVSNEVPVETAITEQNDEDILTSNTPTVNTEETVSNQNKVQELNNYPKPIQKTSNSPDLEVNRIVWDVPDNLSDDPKMQNYLRTTGKSIKLALSTDLLLATEYAYTNKVKIGLKVSSGGSIENARIIFSSGSSEIDNIVLQSVKDILNSVRPPSNAISGQNFNLSLIIYF